MNTMRAAKFQKQLNGGLCALVLLAMLDQSREDLYGYDIAKRLKSREGKSIFKEGTLYPVLRSLAADRLLTSRIVLSYGSPPRRYYQITTEGHATLRDWKAIWAGTRQFVDGYMATDQPPGVTAQPSV